MLNKKLADACEKMIQARYNISTLMGLLSSTHLDEQSCARSLLNSESRKKVEQAIMDNVDVLADQTKILSA